MIHNANFTYCGECNRHTPHAHLACMFCGFVTVHGSPSVFEAIKKTKAPTATPRHVEITPKHELKAVPATREQWGAFLAGLKEIVR